ncbi:MAG: NAD(P)-binding domain-containing protein [Gammaproteobacteria bacterium]|jgi:thioredoxin reductase/NAD-dependent dihydropyrimidine dehydrogenase PreA subunit
MENNSQFIADLLYLLSVTGLEDLPKILIYAIPIVLSWLIYRNLKRKKERKSQQVLEESCSAGYFEPTSLHPIIDRNICLGCATCVDACPEGNVLGVINEKAQLVNPSHCIGHGACKNACPTDAITLVLGSEKRGVDIPNLQPNFETNVPGVFVAGELGGMGLIRNAVEQGRQAMESIARSVSTTDSRAPYDVVIIGAGPAGFSATLYAHEHNLNYVTVEQESLGGSVAHYPRGKIVMTSPLKLPLIGQVKLGETTKEILMNFWRDAEQKSGIRINSRERMEKIDRMDDGFVVSTQKATYHTKTILLSIGRRGTPRKLGVPGEESSKVVYRLDDPTQYRNHSVLIVGGGNSALEAALAISEEPDTRVTLSYRGTAFQNANPRNIAAVDEAAKAGRVQVLMQSNVKRIGNRDVAVLYQGREFDLPNDNVIICAGGVLPTAILKDIGIEVETKYGTA